MISRTKKGDGLSVSMDQPVTKTEAAAIEKLVAGEFRDGNWVTVEGEELVTGEKMMDEVIKEPTLDVYLDRSPKLGEPINYPEMVGVLHRKREMFITAEAKRKSGIKEDQDGVQTEEV